MKNETTSTLKTQDVVAALEFEWNRTTSKAARASLRAVFKTITKPARDQLLADSQRANSKLH